MVQPRRAGKERHCLEQRARLLIVIIRVISVLRIKSSSAFPELDREVEAMIKRAEPLPPIPDDLAHAKLELQVPVQFRLR